MLYTPPAQSIPHLGKIVELIQNSSPIDKAFSRKPMLLSRCAGGELYLDSELQLDTDGWTGGPGADPTHQSETSLRYHDGSSLNANTVPYFVLPKPVSWSQQLGVSVGDYAMVLFENLITPAVLGDFGPEDEIGEGSLELLRLLGQERLQKDGRVINVGMGPRVLTIIFPGSGKKQRGCLNEASLIQDMAIAKHKFTLLGGVI